MIESIHFKNFKVLTDATLPLGPCTIVVGPNGSGKTTVLQALEWLAQTRVPEFAEARSAVLRDDVDANIELAVRLAPSSSSVGSRVVFAGISQKSSSFGIREPSGHTLPIGDVDEVARLCSGIRVFSLDPVAIARPVRLTQDSQLAPSGEGLAGVLDQLRDDHEEHFNGLSDEFTRWLPEFDRIQLRRAGDGTKAIALRLREGGAAIAAADVSQGTLLALALLTLAYLPEPPSLVGLEEPDRAIHPRLLRRVQDALYRLAYPESQGLDRPPVQIVATTHNPYFLDLFRDHPEEVVVAEKVPGNVRFSRLSERTDVAEILGTSPLGEAWFSGILGGVPSQL
jgi:predicted ATPase